ncbi:alpha/beta hydrolase [Marinivivus vitaminiproducens]|uniref:alpha/beta hydrolase n=1 Tax=Marinivivus vitaminiproducens TaxID=3035935 RepID=UPI0027A47D6C|nr:alpha/beta fold hydrolase [Geminicoccaceae bacterium SCSIO 64248]
MALLDGPRAAPASRQPARQLVVMLHGVGADGADLIGLAPLLAQALPDAAFVAPNAPEPCDMAPFGYQWFSLQDRQPSKLLAGVQTAAPLLDAFIDAELARHSLNDDRLAVLGFSQGTMMALYTAPRRPRACAAVLGYSGALLGAELLPDEIRSKPPVLLIHGDADTIVPVGASRLAEEGLRAAGVPVEGQIRPGLAHGIDPEGIALGAAFLKTHLG